MLSLLLLLSCLHESATAIAQSRKSSHKSTINKVQAHEYNQERANNTHKFERGKKDNSVNAWNCNRQQPIKIIQLQE